MEEKLLLIMLYSPIMENKKDVFFYVQENMFFDKENRKIFKAIKTLFDDNNDVFSLIKLEEFYQKVIQKVNDDKIKDKIINLLIDNYGVLGANINYYITELQNKYFDYQLQEISRNQTLTFFEKKQAIKKLEDEQEKIAINYEHKDGILSFSDCFDDILLNNYESDNINWYTTNWQTFNSLVKVRTGYLMVVSGYPSRGKTTFVDNLLVDLSKKYDMKHLIASFETDNATHYNTLVEMYTQKPLHQLKKEDGIFNDKNFNFVTEHFIKLDNKRQWTIEDICKRAEYAKNKYGIKTLTIDPYNKLKRDFKEREDLFVGNILSQLCSLAKKLDILVIFVAHPKKPDGEQLPTMYNISGSGDWYNMADYGIIVHRSRDENGKLQDMPTVAVQKVKNFFLGNPTGGEIQLYYSKDKRILQDRMGV